MAAVTISSDFGAQENKICYCVHSFPFYLPWSEGTGCHDLRVLNVEFQIISFTLLFHLHWGCSVSLHFLPLEWYHLHIWCWIFHPAILIPACNSSSLAFHMRYSACMLNRQDDNIYSLVLPLFQFSDYKVMQLLQITSKILPNLCSIMSLHSSIQDVEQFKISCLCIRLRRSPW